jgi:hypothetical protein
VAGGEGPNVGAAFDRDSLDMSDRKTEAQGALWKRPDSSGGASGRGAEARPVRCWLRAHEGNLTWLGCVRSWA